ncbi:MAG TPA: transposase, partial [Thermoplasmatales archaeon]|nr:transposase [Thermoplasmatales archaeon]
MGCSTPEVRRLIVKARKRGCTMNEITEMFEVSRWTVWRWMKRAHHPGRESYRDKSRRPHTIHKKITQQVENAIIILRDSFSWGSQRIKVVLSSPPPYIRYFLESVLGTKWNPILLSRQSINNVLRKHRRNGFPPGGKREWKYFRAEHPNDMWQIDIKGPFSIDGKRMLALIITDDHSRFRISCTLFTSMKTQDVLTELSQCFSLYGIPKKVLVDRGSQFKTTFNKWCKKRGIEVTYTPKRYPQAKGKVERDIRNFKEEFLVLGNVFDNHVELLEEYNHWSNYDR